MLIEEYAALSPDGRDHFPVVFKKVARALIDTPQTLADLARISAPTLIMAGDDDLVAVEHLEAMRAGVQDGQLLVDVLKDVVLAKQIDKDRQATMSETDSSTLNYAWDRAANSLRLLQLHCEQHRDQQTRPTGEAGEVRSAQD
jgi:pimeloyl-ACP methyl ester carboxylesterase